MLLKNLRFFIGDVRDQERLTMAVDVDLDSSCGIEAGSAASTTNGSNKTNIHGAQMLLMLL